MGWSFMRARSDVIDSRPSAGRVVGGEQDVERWRRWEYGVARGAHRPAGRSR